MLDKTLNQFFFLNLLITRQMGAKSEARGK